MHQHSPGGAHIRFREGMLRAYSDLQHILHDPKQDDTECKNSIKAETSFSDSAHQSLAWHIVTESF